MCIPPDHDKNKQSMWMKHTGYIHRFFKIQIQQIWPKICSQSVLAKLYMRSDVSQLSLVVSKWNIRSDGICNKGSIETEKGAKDQTVFSSTLLPCCCLFSRTYKSLTGAQYAWDHLDMTHSYLATAIDGAAILKLQSNELILLVGWFTDQSIEVKLFTPEQCVSEVTGMTYNITLCVNVVENQCWIWSVLF